MNTEIWPGSSDRLPTHFKTVSKKRIKITNIWYRLVNPVIFYWTKPAEELRFSNKKLFPGVHDN